MSLLLAAALAQPWNYNPYRPAIMSRQDGAALSGRPQYAIDCDSSTMSCTVDGGVLLLSSVGGSGGADGGAPANATYITQTASGGLTNEQALSSLTTGVVKVTNGTGVLSTAVAGTDYAAPTSGTAVLLGNGSGGFSSYAGASCGANQYATATSATGALTCSQVAFSDLSGSATTGQLPTIPVTKGGTNLTTIAANQTWVGTAADTVAAKTLPSCSNATTSKLLYDNSTQTFSCGTDQTGGGGGVSPLFVAQGSP